MQENIHKFTYNIKCVYEKDGLELKDLLEEMYINYLKRIKNL